MPHLLIIDFQTASCESMIFARLATAGASEQGDAACPPAHLHRRPGLPPRTAVSRPPRRSCGTDSPTVRAWNGFQEKSLTLSQNLEGGKCARFPGQSGWSNKSSEWEALGASADQPLFQKSAGGVNLTLITRYYWETSERQATGGEE